MEKDGLFSRLTKRISITIWDGATWFPIISTIKNALVWIKNKVK